MPVPAGPAPKEPPGVGVSSGCPLLWRACATGQLLRVPGGGETLEEFEGHIAPKRLVSNSHKRKAAVEQVVEPADFSSPRLGACWVIEAHRVGRGYHAGGGG